MATKKKFLNQLNKSITGIILIVFGFLVGNFWNAFLTKEKIENKQHFIEFLETNESFYKSSINSLEKENKELKSLIKMHIPTKMIKDPQKRKLMEEMIEYANNLKSK